MSGAGARADASAGVGRNDPCPCGSGRKFKHCCIAKPAQGARGPAQRQEKLRALFQSAKQFWDAGRWAEAIPIFLEIVRLDPKTPQAHHDLGVVYLRCGRLSEAAASLQRAIDLDPRFGRALPPLASALEQDARPREAAVAYLGASRAADSANDRQYYSAKALTLEGKLEEAEQELRDLLLRDPERVDARHILGHVLSQRGRFKEAVDHLAQAIELAPEQPFAFLELTTAKRMTEADRALVERVREVAERPGLDTIGRLSMHFGLGKAFDDLGDPEQAMRHYDAANRLKATTIRLDRAVLVKQYDSLIGAFSAEGLAQLAGRLARPVCPGDDKPVLIVGMPRSGTTLVEQVLSSHPDIGAGGELGFWRECLEGWRTSGQRNVEAPAIAEAAERYRALLDRLAPGALRVTDKMPGNFARLWLIRLAFPDARIIHCVRNPVDTCLSIYFTHFQGRHDYGYDRGDLVFYYREYQRLMDHWRRVLPPDRFTEVKYESLIANREPETRRLVEFCGLEWDDACLAPERNARAVATASLWQARQPVYATSVERWRRYEAWLGELRQLLPAAT